MGTILSDSLETIQVQNSFSINMVKKQVKYGKFHLIKI